MQAVKDRVDLIAGVGLEESCTYAFAEVWVRLILTTRRTLGAKLSPRLNSLKTYLEQHLKTDVF
jgi:hypothetical protein